MLHTLYIWRYRVVDRILELLVRSGPISRILSQFASYGLWDAPSVRVVTTLPSPSRSSTSAGGDTAHAANDEPQLEASRSASQLQTTTVNIAGGRFHR